MAGMAFLSFNESRCPSLRVAMLGAARMPMGLVNLDTVNLSLLIVDTGQKSINIPVLTKWQKGQESRNVCSDMMKYVEIMLGKWLEDSWQSFLKIPVMYRHVCISIWSPAIIFSYHVESNPFRWAGWKADAIKIEITEQRLRPCLDWGFNANLKFTTDGADESDDMLKKDLAVKSGRIRRMKKLTTLYGWN